MWFYLKKNFFKLLFKVSKMYVLLKDISNCKMKRADINDARPIARVTYKDSCLYYIFAKKNRIVVFVIKQRKRFAILLL